VGYELGAIIYYWCVGGCREALQIPLDRTQLMARRRQSDKSQTNLRVRNPSHRNNRSSGSDQAMAQDKKKHSGAWQEGPPVEPPPRADLLVQEGKQQQDRVK
jgi:hypothetical protein